MRDLVTAIVLVLAGLLWRVPVWWVGPLASLALPILIPRARHRWRLASLYFAAGSWGLIPGAGVFFGHGAVSYLLGAGLWIGSAALLALPWLAATTPWRAVLALVIDAIPPLGLFGWLSPFAAAGVLFPGTGLVGLGLLILVVLSAGMRRVIMRVPALALLAVLALALRVMPQAHMGPNISGITTHLGPMPASPMAVIRHNQNIIKAACHAKAPFVLLPETIAVWRAGTAHEYEAAVPPGRTWLVGATTFGKGDKPSDSIVEVRHDKPPRILFRAAFPVPVSMWHPWKAHGYQAVWRVPVRKLGSNRVTALVCYDQLLPWAWIEAAYDRPNVILATRNEWWAKGSGVPIIQRQTAEAWSQLIGARLVMATNW